MVSQQVLSSSEDSEMKTTKTSSPEAIVRITVSLLFLLSSTLGEYLALVHLCDLPHITRGFTEYTSKTHLLWCSRVVCTFIIPDPNKSREP